MDALEDRELGFGAVVGLVLRELLFRAVGRVLCALRLAAVAVRLSLLAAHGVVGEGGRDVAVGGPLVEPIIVVVPRGPRTPAVGRGGGGV